MENRQRGRKTGGGRGSVATSQSAPNRSIKRKSPLPPPPTAAQFFMIFHCMLRLPCVCVCEEGVCVFELCVCKCVCVCCMFVLLLLSVNI